jgi:hypothetical protein
MKKLKCEIFFYTSNKKNPKQPEGQESQENKNPLRTMNLELLASDADGTHSYDMNRKWLSRNQPIDAAMCRHAIPRLYYNVKNNNELVYFMPFDHIPLNTLVTLTSKITH